MIDFGQHKEWLPRVIVAGGVVLLGVVVAVFYYFVLPQGVAAVSVAGQESVAIDRPITITFARPVNRKMLALDIEPAVAGEWHFENMLIGRHFARAVSFVPDTVFKPGMAYRVTLKGITSALGSGTSQAATFTFVATPLADIAHVRPSDGATDVTTMAAVTFTLDHPAGQFTEWEFRSEPEFGHTLEVKDQTIVIRPDEPLRQGTTYRWRLERALVGLSRATGEVIERHDPTRVSKGTFRVLPPPDVTAIAPTGDLTPVDSEIILTFSRPMDTASVDDRFSLKPSVDGATAWSKGDTVLTFTPDAPLDFDTKYAIRVAAGANDQQHGFLDEPINLSFRTIGPVTVVAFSPAPGRGGVTINRTVRVDFNQPVDHASAESTFSITPAVRGSFQWDELTLVFAPDQELAFQTAYTVTIDRGVASVAGQPSRRSFATTFTTQPHTTLLAVRLDYQDRPLSCEAAALKMALANKGVFVSEGDIMNRVGYDFSGPRQGNVWGDPDNGFVGDIDGRQNTTGYGVHWGPVARAAGAWRSSEAFSGWSTERILNEVAKGHAIVIWGIVGGGYYDPWSTSEGKTVNAWKGEHTRTIIGFLGTPADPAQIILNDPISGRLYWSRQTFEANSDTFNFSGVVVR